MKNWSYIYVYVVETKSDLTITGLNFSGQFTLTIIRSFDCKNLKSVLQCIYTWLTWNLKTICEEGYGRLRVVFWFL